MRKVALLITTVLLAGCTETSMQPTEPEMGLLGGLLGGSTQSLFRPLRWEPMPSPLALRYRVNDGPAQAAADYTASFWALKGVDRTLEIEYRGADGGWYSYVRFAVPSGGLSRRPDGSSIASGDSVLITVTSDTENLVLHMEPTGLQFSRYTPAHLRWWYTGADPDINGDGRVNLTDALIEQTMLKVLVQDDVLDPWNLLDAVLTLLDKRFDADIKHFSGYAVAW